MTRMTDKEIIKDFEEYTRNMRENCVIKEGVVQVSKELWHQISDIIDALGADNKRLYQNLNEAHIDIKEKQAEIERLQSEKDNLIKTYKECATELVKEFVERLKKEIDIRPTYSREQNKYVVFLIDSLAKEMVGEG